MIAIRLIINDNEIELSDLSRIGLTYQINDINNLQNRQGTLSNEFRVPKNKNNQLALGFASVVNSATNIPYQKNIAKVIEDGVEIIPDGVAVIQSFDGFYKIAVYSGNIDLFDAIGEALITDLDYSEMLHLWNYVNVLASQFNTDSYIYGLADWGKNAQQIPSGLSVYSLKQFGMVFCKKIIEKIVAVQDYELGGSLIESDFLANLLITVDKWVKSADYILLHTVSNVLSVDTTDPHTFDIAPTGGGSTNTGTVYNIVLNTPSGAEMNPTVAIFTPVSDVWGNLTLSGSVKFIKDSLYFNSCDYIFDIYDVSPGGGLLVSESGFTNIDMFPSGEAEYSFNISTGTVHFAAGRQFQGRLTIKSNLPTANNDFLNWQWKAGTSFAFVPQETLAAGDPVDFKALLPKIKQKDFIKGICNMTSTVFQTNVITKKIEFNFLDDIIANIPKAVDWSGKIQTKGIAITYRNSNYAQKNWLRYQPDDTVAVGYGDGFVECPDLNLDKEKDLVQLPFAASEYYLNLGAYPVPRIKSYVSAYQFDAVQPRVLSLEKRSGTGVVLHDSIGGGSAAYTDAPFVYFIDPSKTISLGFQTDLIANYYKAVSGILQKYKEINAPFNLNAVDIAGLDFLIPIELHIHEDGQDIDGFFYLNKVSNYKGGAMTACNLIRL